VPELPAPPGWRTVDFLSDLHLDSAHRATLRAFARYLQTTPADAVFILGDLFEVWVGDDAIAERGSFEAQCCALLARAARARPLFFMPGNRDFLIGPGFTRRCAIPVLADPTVLPFAGHRWLLSHGDALCLDDVQYQRWRAQSRDPQWQAALLARPLPERRAQGRSARSQSQARKESGAAIYADVNAPAAIGWLRAARADALIHGHTHQPGDHTLAPGLTRHVLTDWDLDASPARAGVLRLSADGLRRVPVSAA
jgi:UDP-2,3-diacylglucosamine hydrolase